ncbi:MAG: phosphodiester glycosidase family protein, partial [Chitinophagaceae bacterium]|nr:phosphodiester glycosidase family protein [Chitinophagaceae bacterium]
GHILSSNEFLDNFRLNKTKITYATQSGPMLITNGVINRAFDPQSKNLNLRSGVGILPNGNIVFAITQSNQTNFFTFASAFKRLGCDNALFLDGAISRMYLKDTRPGDLGGDFGAIISVTTKK